MTNAGSFLLAGYEMVKDAHGEAAGWRWLEQVKEKMDDNYREMDSMTESGKYDPNINATEQGLPNTVAEFQRVYGARGFKFVECGKS